MPILRLFLLGPLDIRLDGQPLPKPPTLKSQSLFAYLALHRQRPQPRERLADLFWGDRPERRARRSLTTALWHIRRCLPGEDWLVSDVHSAQLDPAADLWLDVAAFESLAVRSDLASLQSAVALYRGDFMEGFYDDWVLNERYRLETLFSEALARVMVGLEADGEDDRALSTAVRLLQHDPLREDAHRLAMRAFCRLGQRDAALEQYRRCQETVHQELSAEPMVETTELYQAILDGRLEIGQPVGPIPAVEGQGLPPATHPLEATPSSPLVGRDREMAFLRDRFQEALQGRGSLVLVSGEVGVGKTRLVESFASQVRWQGACVLWGRCYEFERILPYQPVAEALRAIAPTMTRAELEGHAAWVLTEVARLVPEVAEKLPHLGATPALRSDQERMRLFEGLVRFLAHLSRASRLLIVLEDLHWAAESTLQLIHYLARHLAPHPVLIVGTLRPEVLEQRHPLVSLQQELTGEGLAASLRLEPLSSQAVAALVSEMSGAGEETAPLAGQLYQETGGNPFFLMEVIKTLFEAQWIRLVEGKWTGDFVRLSEGALPRPAGVSETIQTRVRRLDDDTQQALQLAAVLGREFDFQLLEALWGRGEEATLEALEVLLRRRFIEEGTGILGRDYCFTHHMIQETVYAGIPQRHRQRAHGRAGQAMERLYGPQVGDLAGELAFHFQEGAHHHPALRDRAVSYLLQAGDRARLAYAHQDAIVYYERALGRLRERRDYQRAAQVLMKLGLTYHNAFDFARARQAYDEGFALWQRAGEAAPAGRLPLAPHALRVAIPEPLSLDLAVAYDEASIAVISHLFSGLLDLSHELDIVPDVAQSWEVLEGGRRYVFHLRDDQRWSDGTRVTAGDFEYALKRTVDPATGALFASLLYDLKGARAFHQGEVASADSVGVQAVDDVTLVMELEEPTGHFLSLLTRCGMPVPRHVVEVHREAWTRIDHLVTSGPFMLPSWEAGRSMVLTRNPAYRGRSRGNAQQVELALVPSSAWAESLGLYERDELDVVSISAFPSQELEAARQRHAGDYVTSPRFETCLVGFLTSKPPFDDVRVRRALALALDREFFADEVLGGHVSPGNGGMVPPGMPGHSAGIGLPHDPDQARHLLAAAGYPGGRGFPLVDGVLTGPSAARVGRFLEDQWRDKLGVTAACRVVKTDAANDLISQGPPLLAEMTWVASYPDPDDFLGVGASHAQWFSQWQSETFDRLVDEARRTTNQKDRMELYRRADRVLIEEVGGIPIFYGRSHLLVKPWIRNYFGSQISKFFWKEVIIEPH